MPAPTLFHTGQPCWLDLQTRDPDGAAEFYGELFGWSVEPTPADAPGYRYFTRNGKRVAGMVPIGDDADVPQGWTVYLATTDADATARAVRENGGEVLSLTTFAELGTVLIARDVTGALVGAWQAGTFGGFELVGEPGAPLWHELHARNFDDAVTFYERAFGWETAVLSATAEFRFTTLGEGDDAVAGIFDATETLPEIEPSKWVVYFGVDNANAAAVRVTELHGAMLERVTDTPYGRMAQAADPGGATFYIMQAP